MSVSVFAKAVFYVSSLLFSLYINGLVDELKKSSCGVDLEWLTSQ